MGREKKGFGPYDRQPRKNLHTAISVNKLKLSVTKHDQTLILAHMYDTSRYTANTLGLANVGVGNTSQRKQTHQKPTLPFITVTDITCLFGV